MLIITELKYERTGDKTDEKDTNGQNSYAIVNKEYIIDKKNNGI